MALVATSLAGSIAGGFAVALIVVLVVLVGGIVLLVLHFARKRDNRVEAAVPSAAQESLAELSRRASAALVRTDDAIQGSEQEVEFAVAQYGQSAAAPFATAIDSARGKLREAFRLQQQLDDEIPDTEQQTREWNVTILELCAEANGLLTEQEASFAELRALEKNLTPTIAGLRSGSEAVALRAGRAQTTLAELASQYAEETLATVMDNPRHATERLSFAETALAHAETRTVSGSTNDAAVEVRAAEAAIGQASLLLDAIDRVAADLTTARRTIDDLIANLEEDIIESHALAAVADPSGVIMATERSTRAAISGVKSRLNGGQVDLRALIRTLERANTDIDGVLGAVRARDEQDQRAASMLSQAIILAAGRIAAANDFVSARRGAVGTDARTRLAEASRLLSAAKAASTADTAVALTQAQRADQLALEAIQLAGDDVGGFDQNRGTRGGLPGAAGTILGGRGSGAGVGAGGILGAVLGGILIGDVLGGGEHGGSDGFFGGGGDDFFSGGFGGD